MTTAVRPQSSPGCTAGPQGFHVYDTEDSAFPQSSCLFCPKLASQLDILAEQVKHEPPPGSVVLAEGVRGRAWQRRYVGDGWVQTGGRTALWSRLLEASRPGSRVWLIYVPSEES